MQFRGPNRAFTRPMTLFFDQVEAAVYEALEMILAL